LGFEISPATQSVWRGDVGDLAESLYELMGNEVRYDGLLSCALDAGRICAAK
jgi:hypothetical protein